jgi:hypothetical protein
MNETPAAPGGPGFRVSGERPGERQDAGEEHAVGEQIGGDLAVLFEDSAGGEQHGTEPKAGLLLILIHQPS